MQIFGEFLIFSNINKLISRQDIQESCHPWRLLLCITKEPRSVTLEHLLELMNVNTGWFL